MLWHPAGTTQNGFTQAGQVWVVVNCATWPLKLLFQLAVHTNLSSKKKTSNRRVGVCETNEKTDWQEAPYILRAWTSHFQQLSFLRAGTVSVFFTTVYTPCPAQGLVCNHTTKEWKKCFFLQAGVSFGDKPKEFAGSQELAPNSRTKTNLSTKYLEPIYSRAQPCWSVSVKSAVH